MSKTVETQNKIAKKVIVIGSGFGGLSVAIRLQAQGFQVQILEKLDQPGGRAYVYKQDGFTFDAGPTVITAPHCLEELFSLTGRKMSDYVELISINPFYRLYWDDGYQFDYNNDSDLLFAQIKKKSPQDVDGYKRFLEYSKEVFHEGYTKLAAVPFLNVWSMLKVAPQLIRLGAYRSVYSTVKKYIKDEHLRQAFSFHSLLVGGNPFKSSSIYTLIHFLERNWGVYFARGGTGSLVKALAKYFEEIGGEIIYGAEVERIETTSPTVNARVSSVRTTSGRVLKCDAVVSNGCVFNTYNQLLAHEHRVKNTAKGMQNKKFSMSLFLIYFGTNRTYPNLAHHNVLFGPRYEGLLNDIFNKGVLSDDFSLYLHAPSRTDSTLAPPGCESFYILSPVPHLGIAKVDWEKEAPIYAKKILDYVERKYMPDLSKHIVTQKIVTPEDFKVRLNSHMGSAFSLAPVLTQSAYFRQHNRDKNIGGLYFVGAGTHPGAGVPGVVNSAKATAGLVLEDFA